jgi:hypothetical protein
MKPAYHSTVFPGTLVFLLSTGFYFVLFRTAIHLGQDSAGADLISAAIRGLLLTAYFVGAYCLVVWLRVNPHHQPLAANISLGAVLLLVAIVGVQYMMVPGQLSSPLLPSYIVGYVRRPILIEGAVLITVLLAGWFFRRSGRWVNVVVCGMVAIGFEEVYDGCYSLVMYFVQN